MTAALRVGLTMREVRNPATGELRDAVAASWGEFLAWALPEAAWMPVPNAGEAGVNTLEDFGLDAVILTGGDDLGTSPRRDDTERALLAACRNRDLPVFGVCRGAQLMWDVLGGSLIPVEAHVAQRHALTPVAGTDFPLAEVNSFHRWGLPGVAVPPGANPLALAPDASVEAFVCPERRWTAVMWHPEREAPFQQGDRILLRRALVLADRPGEA